MNHTSARWKGQLRQTLVLSLITICAAQINLHVFTETFTISLGSVCIPAFLYLLDDVAVIPLSVISGFGVFGSRVLIHALRTGSTAGAVSDYLPEVIFYVALGTLLYLFDRIGGQRKKLFPYIAGVVCIDYLSNVLELFARLHGSPYSWDTQILLMIVACIRGLILALVLESLDRYRVMLLTRNHARRYQRLVMLIAQLKGEMLWMDKSASTIEETMNTSYDLYGRLQGDETPEGQELARQALSVAKDVHEIKKEYLLIKQGISQAIQSETGSEGMTMGEIFAILSRSVKDEFSQAAAPPQVSYEGDEKLYTRDPYLFLSIFHNLIANSVEACGDKGCTVRITGAEGQEDYIFSVQDNGPGVPPKYRDSIFVPRFSTKIDPNTGAVSRGLGLCIVRDMVEQDLGGTIRLADSDGGACFVISIPKDRLEAVT